MNLQNVKYVRSHLKQMVMIVAHMIVLQEDKMEHILYLFAFFIGMFSGAMVGLVVYKILDKE
jgi:glycerol uptake facilitator-like aquaporin